MFYFDFRLNLVYFMDFLVFAAWIYACAGRSEQGHLPFVDAGFSRASLK
jgi:hypothetical protein